MRKTRKVGTRVDLSSIMPLRVSNSETIENTHRGSARNEERARTVCTRATHSLNMQKVRASYGNKRFIEFARGSPDTGSCNCESYSLRTSLPFVHDRGSQTVLQYRKLYCLDGGRISEENWWNLGGCFSFSNRAAPCFHSSMVWFYEYRSFCELYGSFYHIFSYLIVSAN